jgi:hypothetical protein
MAPDMAVWVLEKWMINFGFNKKEIPSRTK